MVKATRLGEKTLNKSWSSRLGVCCEAISLTQENYSAKKARRGKAGQIFLGRPGHVKRMKKELIESLNVRNWRNVAQDRERWKKVVEQARTLNRL
jgi:hypothetical protein